MAQLTKTEAYVGAGLVAGLGLLLLAGGKGRVQGGPTPSILPNESMSNPIATQLWTPQGGASDIGGQPFRVSASVQAPFLAVMDPTINYSGPGRDTFTYAALIQNQNGQPVTVWASGVAGVHVGPSASVQGYHLVSASEQQPPLVPNRSLALMPWPGSDFSPISGAPALPGPADLVLAVYQKYDPNLPGANPADADGFSSPTYNPRVPVRKTVWPGLVLFS